MKGLKYCVFGAALLIAGAILINNFTNFAQMILVLIKDYQASSVISYIILAALPVIGLIFLIMGLNQKD